MSFGHAKLDVYKVSLHYVKWAYSQCSQLKCCYRLARDQLLRASQSIPINIAEGTEKQRSVIGEDILK